VLERIRAYPMMVLLLPVVAAILFLEHRGVFYPPQSVVYDSLCVHTFVIESENRSTARFERFEATTHGGRVMLYLLKDSLLTMPAIGDTIISQTRIRQVDSVGSFDYKTYLLRQGIVGNAFAYRYRVHPASYHPTPLRKRLYQRLEQGGLSNDELATVGALTLGYKEDLDPEVKRHFQASGAAHVLAVSGLHTGIIYAIVMALITLGGRRKPLYENQLGRCLVGGTVIAAMWAYAWLTGLSPSVVRAVVMISIWEFGKMIYRQANSINTIASAAVLILLVRPLDLFSVGFQLSFTATFAIVVLAREAEHLWSLQERMKERYRIVDWLIGTVIISIAAQLGTLPFTMYYFGYVSSYFLLTNLIVLPLATMLVPFGLVSIALGGSVIGVWWTKITYGLAWVMNHSVAWIESLPGSTLPVSVNGIMVAVYYALFLALCMLVSQKE